MYWQSNIKSHLHEAFEVIEKEDVTKLNHMIRSGLDPNTRNENGIPLIHKAIDKLNPQIVDLLLLCGGDPNIVSPQKSTFTLLSSRRSVSLIPSYEIQDLTPLMAALNENKPFRKDSDLDYEKRRKIVLSILKHGAKVDLGERKYGLTPIHLAANYARPDFVRALLAYGASPNVLAFYSNEIDCNQDIAYEEKSKITPMLLAVNKIFKKDASECIISLLKTKGDITLNLNIPDDVNTIIEALSNYYPKMATDVFKSVLEESHSKMQYNRVFAGLSRFMEKSPISEKHIERFVSELLGISDSALTLLSGGLYMAHLNSWNGLLAYKGNDNSDVEYYSACSWKVYKQIPKKIKNMIMVLNDIESGKFDTQQMFGISRKDVSNIIKDEIWVQCTNYFTSQNMYLINSSFINKVSKEDNYIQKNSGNTGRIKQIEPFFKREVSNWCDTISALKPGNSFSIAAGGSNHAVFIEFRKQQDGNISRYIYNLGANKELHMNTTDNKIYPHLTVNIPIQIFDTKEDRIINYLSEVIYQKYMLWSKKSRDILYDSEQIGGFVSNSTLGLIPMKYQVTGNCSVKNNNAGMYNRMGEIFKFIKAFEIGEIDRNIYIPKRLFHEKELQHDLSTLKMISTNKLQYPETVEKELFRFLSNRSKEIPIDIVNIPSTRISFALLNMNKANLHYYVYNSPEFMSALDCISVYYKDNKLGSIVKNFEQSRGRLPIKKELLHQDLNSKQFRSFNTLIQKPEVLETQMFDFFNKRRATRNNIYRSIDEESLNENNIPGHRIWVAIKNLSPGVLDFYVANDPMTIKYIDTIAKHYNLPKLKTIVNSYEKRYVITTKKELSF